MDRFIQQHSQDVIGVLNGWDRLRLRGSMRELSYPKGMMRFLWSLQVLLMNFREYVLGVTSLIQSASKEIAEAANRPFVYLKSSNIVKEKEVEKIRASHPVEEGLVCVLSCVEYCRTYDVLGDPMKKKLVLYMKPTKCRHDYFYFLDPDWGLMHLRLQTWFPMNVHICLNGRLWLARQMDKAGIGYRQRDNCFVQIDDVAAAQTIFDTLTRQRWEPFLNSVLQRCHPMHAQLLREHPVPYYWTAEQTEWATDIMFRSPEALAAIYPGLLQHGITQFDSPDVMRFLGQKIPSHGGVNGNFRGEVMSDLKVRPEGIRLKHQVNSNSLKMYDKQGSVLRVETTVNCARFFKTFRRKEGAKPGEKKRWMPVRKSVVDLPRLAKISQASNERYLEALAARRSTQSLGKLAEKVCRPAKIGERRVRAINPHSAEDAQLLAAIRRGEFTLGGFRNRDLRQLLYGDPPADAQEQRRQSAAVTRKLALLRAHGLIKKIPKTHRYQLTAEGNIVVTGLIAAQQASIQQLTEIAA
jgi:hypothetical protein